MKFNIRPVMQLIWLNMTSEEINTQYPVYDIYITDLYNGDINHTTKIKNTIITSDDQSKH